MKVLVQLPMSVYSGYGNDGIGIVRTLMRMGVDVYVNPASVDPPLPMDIAMLLTKRLEAPFDLFICHLDPNNIDLKESSALSSAINVAWTMWEYTSLDNAPDTAETMKERLQYFDVFMGYDAVTLQSVGTYAADWGIPLIALQGGFTPDAWQPGKRDWTGDRFGFCMVGQLHERKNPFVAIKAFKDLKDQWAAELEKPEEDRNYDLEFEGAELHLKTNVQGLHPAMEQWCSKLRIHYATWPEEVLRQFYLAQHVLLAPSRGEGKNLPALEMMATGGTVIASDFGGHQAWLRNEYAYSLRVDLEPMDTNYPDSKSAKADGDHLRELMLHVYHNRDEARRKGELAAQVIPQHNSWDAVLNNFFRMLRDAVPEKGEVLWQKYLMLEPVDEDDE